MHSQAEPWEREVNRATFFCLDIISEMEHLVKATHKHLTKEHPDLCDLCGENCQIGVTSLGIWRGLILSYTQSL